MAHYTGPKARINRRLGEQIYDSTGAYKASTRRFSPPGQHGQRRRRLSDYGRALVEKQKICHYYGLNLRQLKRFYTMAKRMPGNTGENLLCLCERRLDSVVWKAGLARTRAEARQSVAHGHFLVNGKRTTVPSYLVSPEDTIQVRKRDKLVKAYNARVEEVDRPSPAFLAVDKKELTIKVIRVPDMEDVGLPVNVGPVVEFLSR